MPLFFGLICILIYRSTMSLSLSKSIFTQPLSCSQHPIFAAVQSLVDLQVGVIHLNASTHEFHALIARKTALNRNAVQLHTWITLIYQPTINQGITGKLTNHSTPC
jgi:hypothetical protein